MDRALFVLERYSGPAAWWRSGRAPCRLLSVDLVGAAMAGGDCQGVGVAARAQDQHRPVAVRAAVDVTAAHLVPAAPGDDLGHRAAP